VISAYFSRQEFVAFEALPEIEQFNSTFFTQAILRDTI
jgi:hypothetical protein